MRAPFLLALLLTLAGCSAPAAEHLDGEPVAFEAIRFETELGAFTAILYCGETPKTCAFMRGLVERGYYDGRAFGRVIPGFVIQEVDRTGGTTDQAERVEAEFGTRVAFSAGAIGIARDADPDSGGSEFFVMDHPTSTLWGNFTAFAQVVEGMDVVHAIARVPAVRTGPASSVAGSPPGSPVYFGVHDRVPVDPVAMTRVTMESVELPAREAARLPLVVSDTTRTSDRRATMEWPRDLAPGVEAALAWYVSSRDTSPQGSLRDAPAPTLADVEVRVEGAALGPLDVDAANGVLRFVWTPPAPGLWRITLHEGGREVALANVTVG